MGHCRAWLLPLLLTLTAANAQERKPPETKAQVVAKVLEAFKAKDKKTLKALAERDKPDPWGVADQLCFLGEHDAAEAFAKAAPRKRVEKLPAYVASRRGKAPNAAAHKALETMTKAFAAGT